MDAAAVIAGGLPLTVAIGSTRYAWPRHVRGIDSAIILPDNDGDAGRVGATWTRPELELEGVRVTVLDPAILGRRKDVAAYWQVEQSLPVALGEAAWAPVPVSRGTTALQASSSCHRLHRAYLDCGATAG